LRRIIFALNLVEGMADIFFSYSRGDRAKVAKLVGLLGRDGFSVWWDPAIETGEQFSPVIHDELEKAACVIVGWSTKSVKSDWVRYEAGAGRARHVLVPVSLDGIDPPYGFKHLQTLDFQGWTGNAKDARLQRLMTDIRRHVAHPEVVGLEAHPSAKRGAGQPTRPSASASVEQPMPRQKRPEVAPNPRVFLIVASTGEEWQLALNNHLLLALRRFKLSCTVLVPAEDHFLGEHQALQDEVRTDAADYSGGIVIISGWPDDRNEELNRFAKDVQKPVVFVDQNPPAGADKTMPWNMSYISINDSEGGRLAAEAALELAAQAPIRRILIISGFAKQERFLAFRTLVSEKLDCDIVVSEDGKFDRWVSENIAFTELSEAIKIGRPFDLVFCTADSMTLGCLDAIDRIERWRGCAKPRVIGYDGTATTQRLAGDARSLLERVVVQDTKELARVAVEQLMRMRQGLETNKINWVKPYLFPRLKGMSRGTADKPVAAAKPS
jgi:DNA-binding LacI/PurR family transcriptional regulator